jgi:dihydroxyacid dehydratase/phosphogluconate dehydratase
MNDFMEEAKAKMDKLRDEAQEKIDSSHSEPDENGVVTSDDGTAKGQSWSSSSSTHREYGN